MVRMQLVSRSTVWSRALVPLVRHASSSRRYEAFDAGLDPNNLKVAREWRRSFEQATLPKGTTTYSRSSGPGGQHVNKTETKAITAWKVDELQGVVPVLLTGRLRESRYYTRNTDSLTVQAQTHRSRTANADENRQKLYEELVRLYEETVPGETDASKVSKYKAVETAFHEIRIRDKKRQKNKKQSRRGGDME